MIVSPPNYSERSPQIPTNCIYLTVPFLRIHPYCYGWQRTGIFFFPFGYVLSLLLSMCVILLRGPKECVRQLGTTDSFSSQQMLGIQAIKLWTQFLYRREFWKEIALLPQAVWFHVHTDPLKLISQLPGMCWSLSHTLTSISKLPVTPL